MTACLYPLNRPRTAYNKGCRCPRCLDACRAYAAAWRAANPTKVAAYRRRWAQANPEAVRANAARARARRRTQKETTR